jgi:hypothetical protein
MEGKSVDKHLKDARSVLADRYKGAKKKIPQGAEQLGQVAHKVADAGIKAFKEGRRLVNEAADAAEKDLKKAVKEDLAKAKKATAKAKKAAAKKPAIKKALVKKVVAKNRT